MKRKTILTAALVTSITLTPAAALAANPGCVYTGGGWACYGTYPPGSDATTVTVERVAGQTRFDTAVQVSKAFYPDGADTVYLVTVADFPDALAAGGASSVAPGPVLYTNRDTVPNVTLDEIRRLAPDRVVIVGGTGVVSDAVANAVSVAP
jgi:putative cell wall-binding protein